MSDHDYVGLLTWIVGTFGAGLIGLLGLMTKLMIDKLESNSTLVQGMILKVSESVERLENAMRLELRQFESRLTRLETVAAVEKYFVARRGHDVDPG